MVKSPPSNARDMGLIPGQGTKILCAMWHSWRKKKKSCVLSRIRCLACSKRIVILEWEVPSTHSFQLSEGQRKRSLLAFQVSISLPTTAQDVGRAAAATKSLQSCSTLCDPMDGSPSGFPIPGILHARTLEWVAISFSSA